MRSFRPYFFNVGRLEGVSEKLLPAQCGGEIFADEVVVEGAQFGEIWSFVAFRVEVVGIEGAHPFEHVAILLAHEIGVFAIAMGWIKGVVANHVEGFEWKVIFYDMKKIFVVTPGQENLIQTAFVLVQA